ncbi:MAG TPA: glycosyltransferase family 39 protein [Solirubrobacteraceae bacterium]|nr:glycosyltransferase family 39 protein [Solirubrobacteraceae bacterium]
MGALRRLPAAVFAGDRRVWTVAALVAVPCVLLTAFYCLRPRFYFTGTNSVESIGSVVEAHPGAPVCVSNLHLPAHTSFVRLQVSTASTQLPGMKLALRSRGRTVDASLAPTRAQPNRLTNADFEIPQTPSNPSASAATLCLTVDGPVGVGGTPLSAPGSTPPTLAGIAVAARLAIWYLPRAGNRSGYLARAAQLFSRAALFRPGVIDAWTYPLLLLLVLPALALAALRCVALAVAGQTRHLARWLFAIAALNACCWALITPAFQGPDEVDHFAYVQSLAERGEKPSDDPASPLLRWSSAENLVLEDTSFLTDHQVGDTRAPWLAVQQREYATQARTLQPSRSDGGGYTTSAAHGPFYYLALVPAYLAVAHASVFTQLTLTRIVSALLGALIVLFTYLLARELAPRRPWLAVVAALLVAYEPMFGFVSGIVNNDVGVNATAALLELLLIRLLRRGIMLSWGVLTGAVLLLLPSVKGTGLSLYPIAALAFAIALWRHHRRADLIAWAGLALSALLVGELAVHIVNPAFAANAAGGANVPTAIGSNAGAIGEALHHLPDFFSYLWQMFLPRLPFMTPHFPPGGYPGFLIFIKRGWGAFGWYDVLFPSWVYFVILAVSVLVLVLAPAAVRREWGWLSEHWAEALALILMPIAVIAGFAAAYYTPGARPAIAEFGRYAFPAIGPIALLVVGALHGFGRERMLIAGVALTVAVIALSYASQLLALTSFYA